MLSLPNLDDRRYDDLVREALIMIPALAPEWTNHNAADPGVTLVELLAYLTELLIYRVNQISDRQLAGYVSLLTNRPLSRDQPLAAQARNAVLELRRVTRAVTAADYETLAIELSRSPEIAQIQTVRRAHCLPGLNLSQEGESRKRPGHVSLVIVPTRHGADQQPRPSRELLGAIRRAIEEYRLITTRLHVVGPRYVPVRISATLILAPNANEYAVRPGVEAAMQRFFDVAPESPGQEGWPFGRDVYLSELYNLMERQPGVDYVTDVELETDHPSRIMRNPKGEVVGLDLCDNELPFPTIKELRTRSVNEALRSRGVDARSDD